jgi:RHS repeat-associated protein
VSEAALGSFEELDLEYVPEEEGTMMIYTANQTAEDLDVYMDDLTILHTEGPIIRVDDYYPFGLTYNSSERSGFTTNKRLFNGVEFQDELDLGLYQTLFRMYDPMLGRFIQIDPLADFFPGINPYNFGLDNPISFGDPDGLGPLDWLIGTKEERQNRRMSRRNARRSKAQKRRFERKHWVYSPSAKPKEDVKPKLVLSEIEPKRPEPSMDEGNLSLPDIVREVVPKPEPTIGGQPIEAGREIRFDHWPFGSNDYVVRDPSQTNKFLTPIADKLKSNPHLAITIQVLTNLTPDQLDENLATVHPDIKGNRLMWNRGSAIQLALINMGVDSRQIVFMYKPSVAKGAGGINIVVREK